MNNQTIASQNSGAHIIRDWRQVARQSTFATLSLAFRQSKKAMVDEESEKTQNRRTARLQDKKTSRQKLKRLFIAIFGQWSRGYF